MDHLFPYQKEAIEEALHKKSTSNLNGLYLSLPMSYGKTLIGLTLILQSLKDMPTDEMALVICSKTLLLNWRAEIKKFFEGKIEYEILHPDHTKKINEWKPKAETQVILTTPEVVAKSYDTCNVEELFVYKVSEDGVFGAANRYREVALPYGTLDEGIGFLHSFRWRTILVDECQNYCNVESKRCRGIASLSADFRWCLSGTLLQEVNIERIFGLFLLINNSFPRDISECKLLIYGRGSRFRGFKDFCITRTSLPAASLKKLPKLQSEIVSFSLDKYEVICFSMLQNIITELWAQYKELIEMKAKEKARKVGGSLLAMISYLRQSLVISQLAICKLISSLEINDENMDTVKSVLDKTLKKYDLQQWIEDPRSKKSSRIKTCLSLIDKHQDDVIIIFCSYNTCLQYLKKCVDEAYPNMQTFIISSQTSIKVRDKTINDFKSKTSSSILFSTYMLGSEGLNLQNSNVVINLSLYWNDGKERQALARMYRTGQEHEKVYQYILISNTGLEKAILKKQKGKMDILGELIEGRITTTKIPNLSFKDIVKIIEREDVNQLAQSFKLD